MRILIMGLPGSGKSTLAAKLEEELSPDCLWLNADTIREQYNDWDFSEEGRIRQSIRMRELADASNKKYVIADFVCPLPIMRKNYAADYTVWMDTIRTGRYEDTNKIFEPPEYYNIHITEQYAEKYAAEIARKL
ncbi:Adenylylsulphate kinase [uncultured Caudovirales phage]|uniref:Adenylylsulphate kinase n=1 Tax=uncultured Caudovirales phage TaxID=2100421 RepID=A0A6J5LKP3_9CAUD|nr:Adenylylsulphate kinase [uncultured Caudovirales phage]